MGTRWRGMLAPINAPTGDGRRMAVGALTHRPLPLALKWQRQDEGGHTTSVVIGSMDRIDIDEEAGAVWGEGELFDDASPSATPRLAEDVAEAKLLLEKKVIGPSVDPGSAQAVTVIKDSDTPLDDQMMERYWLQHGELPETELLFTDYEIAAATLVPVPAFAQCRPFELLDPLEADGAVEERLPALVAAAGLPPLDPALFAKPDLDTFTRVTMRDLGNGWTHVYGHVAAHSTCHVGMRGVCTTAPYSDHDYLPFHRYSSTADGHQLPVAVGRITSGHGRFENMCRCHVGNDDHACGDLSLGGAVAHHDRMNVLAYVCAGEDEALDAIWFSGVLAPEATEDDIAVLRRRKVSGDWRAYGESMELVEVLALARREPGFPLPRVSLENGRQLSLTAAGVIMPEREGGDSRLSGDGLVPLPPEGIDYDRLGAAVAQHLMAAAAGGVTALTAGARNEGWDDLPIAPGDRTWDSGAAIRRLVEWADGDIAGRYARAFLWRDYDADPNLQGSYKFPVADIIDGELTIVPNAVRNAASRLPQADIPADDVEGVGRVIEDLLERIGERDGMDDDGEAVTAASAEGGHTSGMVALRMSEQDAARLAVPDGLPPEELHLTLAFLGDAAAISAEARERMIKSMTKIARKVGAPIEAEGFGVGAFNPGDANDRPTAIVMNVGGGMLADVQAGVCKALGSCEGFEMPEQHSPWHAHTTLTYNTDGDVVEAYGDRVGPLTFDRMRVAFGDEVIDIPLGEIIEADEDEQDERDEDGAMYAVRAANAVLAQARLAIALEELDYDPAPAG